LQNTTVIHAYARTHTHEHINTRASGQLLSSTILFYQGLFMSDGVSLCTWICYAIHIFCCI